MAVDVRLAHSTDASAIGAMFARAFANDPVTSWVTPDPARRVRLLVRLNTTIARYEGIPRRATYLAEDAGRIVGAAIWRPPKARAINWRNVPFALTAGVALERDIPRMMMAGRAAAGARPRDRHWYLQLLGVDPDAQGTRVGSALVQAHLATIDEQGLPAYLETTVENVGFYARLGFEVCGEIVIHPSAPREYSLVREAR